jgi:hypothetical protein
MRVRWNTIASRKRALPSVVVDCLWGKFFASIANEHHCAPSDRCSRGNSSECLADSHPKSVTVPALGDVGTKIDMIFLAQQKPQTATTAGKEFLFY